MLLGGEGVGWEGVGKEIHQNLIDLMSGNPTNVFTYFTLFLVANMQYENLLLK